jgi:hypothetical protein
MLESLRQIRNRFGTVPRRSTSEREKGSSMFVIRILLDRRLQRLLRVGIAAMLKRRNPPLSQRLGEANRKEQRHAE